MLTEHSSSEGAARAPRGEGTTARRRSTWASATTLICALALALPLASMPAAFGARPAVAASTDAAGQTHAVTLPTGDRVWFKGTAGSAKVLTLPAATRGIGRLLTTQQTSSGVYVIPADAQPYLGHFLDRELFDVSRLAGGVDAAGHLGIRFSYQGATAPALAGVTLTSASAGVASGYLTAKSSRQFGRALTRQWEADRQAGWPKHTTILGGVTRIDATVAGPSKVTPKFPMITLTVKVIGSDGKPDGDDILGLTNVDDSRKYTSFPDTTDGQARVSVPVGTYSAIGVASDQSASGSVSVRVVSVNDFTVTGAGQTITLDYRTATRQQSVKTPKPFLVQGFSFSWNREDAAHVHGVGVSIPLDGDTPLYLAPAGPPKVGTVDVTQDWQLAAPGDNPAYTYDLGQYSARMPPQPITTFTAANLATVKATYFGDGKSSLGYFGRFVAFNANGGTAGSALPVTLGSRRTEYVGALGGSAIWTAELAVGGTNDDPDFVDQEGIAIPAGSTQTVEWLRGPLGAGIPKQAAVNGFCFACRTAKQLDISVIPFLDTGEHQGELQSSLNGIPVARFRFYRNGTLVEDQDDSVGDTVDVSAAKATYKAVFDVDRRQQVPNQSTLSHTEMTFSSAGAGGGALPATWSCALASAPSGCRVLPVVQAKLALPTTLDGLLPAGKSVVTVTVAGIQHGPASAATSAGLEIRPEGYDWVPVALKATGGGRYQGTIDDSNYPGALVDVRIGGADAAGSTYTQTVLHAYTVAGS